MEPTGLTSSEVTQIYERYGFLLQRRACLITRDSALAEDAVHEALLKLLGSGGAFRAATHPLRWLQVVVDRSCIDQLRRNKRLHGATNLDDEAARLVPHPGVDLEARDRALRLLGQLDERDQRIAIGAFIDGMSQEQIGNELGYSRVTVNKRLQAIKRNARARLENQSAAPGEG